MAGDDGIEPPNVWIKIRCLTTWRIPYLYGGDRRYRSFLVGLWNRYASVYVISPYQSTFKQSISGYSLTPQVTGRICMCFDMGSYMRIELILAESQPAVQTTTLITPYNHNGNTLNFNSMLAQRVFRHCQVTETVTAICCAAHAPSRMFSLW